MPRALRSKVARETRQEVEQNLYGVVGGGKTPDKVDRQRALRNQVQEDTEGTTCDNYDGSIIIAKEGKRYLVLHPGSGMRADILDSIEGRNMQIDHECREKLAPPSHAEAIRGRVQTAKGDQIKFAEGLEKVRESNLYGIRKIWRLEFNNGIEEVGLNCGKTEHGQICSILGINSFHDLLLVQQPQSNAAPAPLVQAQCEMEDVQPSNPPPEQDKTGDVQMEGTESEPPTPVISNVKRETPSLGVPISTCNLSMMEKDKRVSEERNEFIEKEGKVIIAEQVYKQISYALIKEKKEVRIVENTPIIAKCGKSFGPEEDSKCFSPPTHLDFL
jgi:hypothetical protein